MPSNLEKLRALLQELFQLNQADLDFGIYRIMNTRRDEIVRFLDKDLLPQVQEAFKAYKPADKAALQKELDEKITFYKADGVDLETVQKVKDLRKKLAESAVDVGALENEVFSHLFNFFRRYYSEGDFISQRRYKEGIYAIPYEGEEVKLHWANADQYYIKSSESFRDYTFTVSSGKRVRVHLVAASTAQENNKAAPGQERRFVLCEGEPLREDNGELYICFEYRPADAKQTQDTLNATAIERILNRPKFEAWAQELSKAAPTEHSPTRTILAKHLSQYTARNTFDYFIHKDLGSFLRRELDFYIKNEVMHLDDIEHESAPKVDQYLSQIKVIRSIAHKLIAFLEQLENFQKKLWLKKKFVIETHYCITLDRIPESLYGEIAANDGQQNDWRRLFAIDELHGDLHSPAYSTPPTVDFLKANPFLVVDTSHFSRDFTDRLLASIADLDESLDGVLINGDNFHALRLLLPRFAGQIACAAIDPPYNTGTDGFVYKDTYQHSSWLSMMNDRLHLARLLLRSSGSMFVCIDDNEVHNLRHLVGSLFGETNFVTEIEWQKRYTRSNNTDNFTSVIDHILVFARSQDFQVRLQPRTEEADARFLNPDNDPRGPWKAVPFLNQVEPEKRRNLCYPITNPITGTVTLPEKKAWRRDKEEFERLSLENRFWWGRDGKSLVPDIKVFLTEVRQGMTPINFWDHEFAGHTDNANAEIKGIFGHKVFDTPKPSQLLERICEHATKPDDTSYVLDFFAGSGSTGHAVISLNRRDKGNRKYILVEMADYFDSVLKDRIAKVIYSPDWKDGKPLSRRGSSHALKYIRLESYEDALRSLRLDRTDEQQMLVDSAKDVREQYMLSYLLDVESRGSQSLLNVPAFRTPNKYHLEVSRDNALQKIAVDLVETFNWLIGLTVKHVDVIRGVRVVDGITPERERVLILWRNVDEMDNDKLYTWFEKQGYNTREMVYDLFYVNGDNNLENLRRPDETWKVRLIEVEFQRLMFDAS